MNYVDYLMMSWGLSI